MGERARQVMRVERFLLVLLESRVVQEEEGDVVLVERLGVEGQMEQWLLLLLVHILPPHLWLILAQER
jgi:hypothetical protein